MTNPPSHRCENYFEPDQLRGDLDSKNNVSKYKQLLILFVIQNTLTYTVNFVTSKMEGCCSFKSLIGGVCGYNTRDRMRETEIVPLLSCTKNIASHESAFKFTGPEDEIDLILCRAHICRPLHGLRF